MTPKSLLRLPQATNRIEHLSETRFFPVLGEPRVAAEKVTRLVLCTGKIYYDLVGHPSRQDNEAVAIGRVELLYPFPEAQILELIDSYPNLREVVWVQEEPRNMGARAHMSPRLMQILPRAPEVRLHRPARARLAGRGLPRRPHRRAEPHPAHRAGPRRCPSRCIRRSCRASAERGPAARGRLRPRRHAARHDRPRGARCSSGCARRSTRSCPASSSTTCARASATAATTSTSACSAARSTSPTYRRLHLIAVCEPWGEPSEALQETAVRLRDEQLGALALRRARRSSCCATCARPA